MAVEPEYTPPLDEPEDEPEDQDEPEDEDEDRGPRTPGYPRAVAATGAGWLLGLLLWAWVGLPFIKGGPTGVKNVWRAKFFNKAPDGSELP